jgi:hypothetical protein
VNILVRFPDDPATKLKEHKVVSPTYRWRVLSADVLSTVYPRKVEHRTETSRNRQTKSRTEVCPEIISYPLGPLISFRRKFFPVPLHP